MELDNSASLSNTIESLLLLRIEDDFSRTITQAKIDSEINFSFKKDLLKDDSIKSERKNYGACEMHRRRKWKCDTKCPERICKEVIAEVIKFRIKYDDSGRYNHLKSAISKTTKIKSSKQPKDESKDMIMGRRKNKGNNENNENKNESKEEVEASSNENNIEILVPFNSAASDISYIEEEICNSENYNSFSNTNSSIDYSRMNN